MTGNDTTLTETFDRQRRPQGTQPMRGQYMKLEEGACRKKVLANGSDTAALIFDSQSILRYQKADNKNRSAATIVMPEQSLPCNQDTGA